MSEEIILYFTKNTKFNRSNTPYERGMRAYKCLEDKNYIFSELHNVVDSFYDSIDQTPEALIKKTHCLYYLDHMNWIQTQFLNAIISHPKKSKVFCIADLHKKAQELLVMMLWIEKGLFLRNI